MQFRSKELLVLVALDVGVDGLLRVLEDLIFESVAQVEHDFVGVCLDGVSEEVDFELDI